MKKIVKFKDLFFVLPFIFSSFFFLSFNLCKFQKNISRVEIHKLWQTVDIKIDIDKKSDLADDIPDGWSVHQWGGATGKYCLDISEKISGEKSLKIVHNNEIGKTGIIQNLELSPNKRYKTSVYTKGRGGAWLVKLRDNSETYLFWQNIPASEDWIINEGVFMIPSSIEKSIGVAIVLHGTGWFDNVFLGEISDIERTIINLLINPSFEKDGIEEESLDWWRKNITFNNKKFNKSRTIENLNFQNIVDTLNGNFSSIRKRSDENQNKKMNCPQMTGWLLYKGYQAESNLVKEQIFKMAVSLIPYCPQPYAALGSLYEQNASFSKAADYYHIAASLSGETVYNGTYSFREGSLKLFYTGEVDEAILALKNADEYGLWQDTPWHKGIATLYLGQALEKVGQVKEAELAYQRVLDCASCKFHWESAYNALKILDIESK